MTISASEAREALRAINESADRSQAFRGYRLGAPFFFLWGAIWVICYGATGIDPHFGVIWLPAIVIGMAISAVIGRRIRLTAGMQREPGHVGRTMWATFLAFGLFVTATYAIMRPHESSQLNAFPALVTGMAYTLAGLWTRRFRFVAVGAVIAAATIIGFFYLTPWLPFWLAAIGGGGLILTGFWMRTA